jgi:hypothetical protein
MHTCDCEVTTACRVDSDVNNDDDDDDAGLAGSATSSAPSASLNETDNNRPDCWDHKQCMEFKLKNPWLVVADKKLGCTVCWNVKSVNVKKANGMKLSAEWVNGTVASNGETVAAQQSALRKKIYLHKNSEMHKCAMSVTKEAQVAALPNALASQQKDIHDTTGRVFRTVYKQVKLNRPFLNFESEIDVQTMNDVNLGRILHSNVACGNTARHICVEMRKSVTRSLVNNTAKFAILIDELTTVSKLETMIIYIRTSFDETGPMTMFLDLVELQSTTARNIVSALLACLNSHGLSDDIIREHCVGLATDGASVMLGKQKWGRS